jgi:outer membrane protein TolC
VSTCGRDPPIDFYFGVGVSIPLRIFDRNQGEKLRTKLDIDRQQRLLDVSKAQVFSDVDSAYAQVQQQRRPAAALQSEISAAWQFASATR